MDKANGSFTLTAPFTWLRKRWRNLLTLRPSTRTLLGAKPFLMVRLLSIVRLPLRVLKISLLPMFLRLSSALFFFFFLFFFLFLLLLWHFVRIILRQWRALLWVLCINVYPCQICWVYIYYSFIHCKDLTMLVCLLTRWHYIFFLHPSTP